MKFSVYCICVIALISAPLSTDAGELSRGEFETLHKQLQPDPDAAWRTIPWEISVLEGNRIATTDRKPIFIWAMDGHPLGCT